MAEHTYDAYEIAVEQLETALRLWEEGREYLSVITLAGAAEEILGKCVRANGGKNALERMKGHTAAMSQHLFGRDGSEKATVGRANRARNALKHLDAADAPNGSLDAREEAKDMLNRAIDNYWLLKTELTPRMVVFQREQHSAASDGR